MAIGLNSLFLNYSNNNIKREMILALQNKLPALDSEKMRGVREVCFGKPPLSHYDGMVSISEAEMFGH